MGPLVPDIIGNELNFVVAFFVGTAFGFILEQAGFSTSKKLVGLFYGYDFTVLRVFFTAGLTAMIGVIALGHYGLLDLELIYINPTFLYSALVGGLIMGLGFVIGGFCPGTSLCAAAIGKIDAMYFVAGSFIGVFIFAEGFPMFENLYLAENWGNVRVFDSLGMSQGLFAFLLTAVAVMAFIATTKIENRVNKRRVSEFQPRSLYMALIIIAFVIGLSAFAMPDRKEVITREAESGIVPKAMEPKAMTADEFSFRVADEDRNLQIFDLRDAESFKQIALPNSHNVRPEAVFSKDYSKMFLTRGATSVFVADDVLLAKKAATMARLAGYDGVAFLDYGFPSFVADYVNYSGTVVPKADKPTMDKYRWRISSSETLKQLIEKSKAKQSQKKEESKRVVGGC